MSDELHFVSSNDILIKTYTCTELSVRFGVKLEQIHYIAKSIGTPFFRTEKCTSKSVATTMEHILYLKIVFHLCSNSFVSV